MKCIQNVYITKVPYIFFYQIAIFFCTMGEPLKFLLFFILRSSHNCTQSTMIENTGDNSKNGYHKDNYSRALIHAVKEKKHFTQSALLLAAHPLFDALFYDMPALVWFFRFESYKRFGYDPDGVFTDGKIDVLGFSIQRSREIRVIASE